MEPPVASSRWSPDFRAQELEVLIVQRTGDAGIVALRPIHAASLQVGWPPGRTADDVLLATLARYGLRPRILHSTSWRSDGGSVVLTYLAVVEPAVEPDPNLAVEPVARSDLARGGEHAAPASIDVGQVLEHALRHLAWLLGDDPVVGEALPAWREPLAGYVPEPFRELTA